MNSASLYLTISFFALSFVFSYGQTDFKLRDPEYLIDQYNQLVAKHNALIEKTRVIITERQQSPSSNLQIEDRLKQQLNESLAKTATLENEISKIKQ